jgi:predicted phage terminase large subunit-like protein
VSSPVQRTEAQERAYQELARRELSRRKLSQFILYTYPGYKMGCVHQEICTALEWFISEVIDQRSPRLMLTMPPRHGKSQIVSRHFPAWVFGRIPDMQIIAASYSSDLAKRMNRDVQRIIDTPRYRNVFPKVGLNGKNIVSNTQGTYLRNSDLFEIVNYKGSYRGAGVGNAITGMGCDILNIDDPLKDRKDASSKAVRDSVWDWYASTAYTRLSPGGGVLVTQTRWHEDDLAGRLLQAEKEGGDKWRVINFPAIADQDEEHRKAGEALHPERYPLESLRRIEKTIGSYEWTALYQQSPKADGGNIFKSEWIQYYYPKDLPKRFDKLLQSWDLTFKDTDGSDFVVGSVWGRCGGDFYLLDLVRERMGFTRSVQAIKDMTAKHPKAIAKLVEDKANGPAVMDTLRRGIPGLKPVEPDGSKVARAHAVTPIWESHNVFIPHPSVFPWVQGYIDELTAFPNAKHDDQVDSTTQALRELMSSTNKIWEI